MKAQKSGKENKSEMNFIIIILKKADDDDNKVSQKSGYHAKIMLDDQWQSEL
jgi:hypothetical protein